MADSLDRDRKCKKLRGTGPYLLAVSWFLHNGAIKACLTKDSSFDD